MKTPLLACLVCISLTPLGSAELIIRDVRLGIGTRATAFDFSIDNGATTRSGSDAYDGALAIDGGLRWSFARAGDSLGIVIGADLGLEAGAYGGGDGYQAITVRACVGPAWAVNDRWTAALELGFAAGQAQLDLPASVAANALSLSGDQQTIDIRAVLDARINRDFSLGIMVGYVRSTQTMSGSNLDLDLTLDGFQGGIELRWRFDDAPTRLE